MKICPTCNRPYADETLAFCLDDGSTLSSTYSQHETERISASRNTDPAPTEVLYPVATPPLTRTIQSLHPPIYSGQQPSQPQEKRKTGLVLMIGIILGVILALVIAGVWLRASKNSAVDNQSTNNRAESNISNSNKTAPNALTELSGKQWQECETTAGVGMEICGLWMRKSKGLWFGQWGEVEANLEIAVDGKSVTVRRRDITSSLEATYRGTLNTDNTQITGTVDWCCDDYGNRSGTWRAEITTTAE